jgi:hypothetical protein
VPTFLKSKKIKNNRWNFNDYFHKLFFKEINNLKIWLIRPCFEPIMGHRPANSDPLMAQNSKFNQNKNPTLPRS